MTILSGIEAKLDAYFHLTERGTTVLTEFRAGTASFLTLSYLVLVNPQIMAAAGIEHSDAVWSTTISSAVSCFIVGFVANLPFGLAPGLGLSAYLSYGLVLGQVTTLEEAMTACFASGVILLVCALVGVTTFVMWLVPKHVKLAIVVGMGVLIAMIGMVSVDLIIMDESTLVRLGDIFSFELLLVVAGIILVGSLVHHNVPGGILIGIGSLAIIEWAYTDTFPTQWVELPKYVPESLLDWNCLWDPSRMAAIYPSIGAFLLIGILDVSGVMYGLSTLGGLLREDGSIPNSTTVFAAASIGTMLAAVSGSTPIIVTVECAAGVKEGGRTGLTAIVIGLYFLLSVIFSPVFGAVPVQATAPILVLIGVMMMGESGNIDWEHISKSVPAFLTIVMMPLTYSITNGMVFGLLSALAFYFTTGEVINDVKALFNKQQHGEASVAAGGEKQPLVSGDEKQTNGGTDTTDGSSAAV